MSTPHNIIILTVTHPSTNYALRCLILMISWNSFSLARYSVDFNSILRKKYFPNQWETAQLIILHKHRKNSYPATSYRPISLLPILSKVLEWIIFRRMKTIIAEKSLIPITNSGSEMNPATTEQIHRRVNNIISSL